MLVGGDVAVVDELLAPGYQNRAMAGMDRGAFKAWLSVASAGPGGRMDIEDLVAEGDAALAGLGGASGGGVLYNHMTLEDVDRVVERHLVGGMAVRALTNLPPIPIGSHKKPPR